MPGAVFVVRLPAGARAARASAARDGDRRAGFPASHRDTIGVAASTDPGRRAGCSQTGPALDLCAPSSGGVRGICTTDMALPRRGFNPGRAVSGGP